MSLSVMLFTTVWIPTKVTLSVSPVFVAAALLLRVKVVVFVVLTEAMVAPAGMPIPVTAIPAASPTVLEQVTVVLPEVVATLVKGRT